MGQRGQVPNRFTGRSVSGSKSHHKWELSKIHQPSAASSTLQHRLDALCVHVC